MRLIDADALKAEFTGNFHENWHYTAIWAMIDVAPTIQPQGIDKDRLIDTAEAIIEVLEGVIEDAKQIPSQPTTDGWIPVSVRLPETCENILICLKDDYVNAGYYSFGEFRDMCSMPYKDVTAWQPLPQPYKESE